MLHSRVARSLVQALRLVGARVTLVGPPPLVPAELGEVSHDIDAIRDADVVYVLRMQRERMEEGANYVPSLREYSARWCVTPERLRPGQRVMHPGPMNRGVEIDPRVADSPDALVVDQVRAGLVVRMAVLYDLLTTGPGRGRDRRGGRMTAAVVTGSVLVGKTGATTSSSAARACSTRRAVSTPCSTCASTAARSPSSAPRSTRTATA